MLDYTSAVIQLAFVVFLVNQVAVAQKDPNAQQHHSGPPSHIPEQCRNGEMNANSRDCDSYFECVNGRFQLKLCPYGQNFDPATGVCCPEYVCPHAQGQQQQVKDQQQHDQQQHNQQQDNQQQVNNQQQHVYDSTGQQSIECNYGDKRPDQTDCSKYFSCAGEEKRYTRRFCPHGKHFSERLGRCITGGCQNGLIFGEMQADAPCEESSGHSGYRSDPENCRRFYQCAQGKWIHKDCPSNLIWNQNAVVCDWPKEGDRCL